MPDPVANDFAAIAKRLAELEAERKKEQERANQMPSLVARSMSDEEESEFLDWTM